MPNRRRTAAATAGDAELGRLLPAPDGSGLRRLLREYGTTVERALRQQFAGLLGANEIDEVMSLATYRIWRSAERYDATRGGLREWFFTIGKHVGQDLLRRRQGDRREVNDPAIDQLPEPVRVLPRPAPHFLDLLRECVAALPEKQRRVIEADLAHGDVADADALAVALDSTKKSIYSLRWLARKTLREALTARGFVPTSSPEDEGES